MRILVTGSRGVIGTSVVSDLKSKGYDISTLDMLPSSIGTCHFQGDVRHYELVRKALKDVDGVIHLAAVSRVRWGFDFPHLCAQVNIQGTLNVLKSIQQQKKKPWMIFGSSREVYGNAMQIPVKESAPRQPTNVYAASKVAGELLCETFSKNYQIPAFILRFSNAYGSVRDHSDRVVPRFILSALANIPLLLYGEDHTFDFTHLDDTVKGIIKSIDYLETERYAILQPVHLLTGHSTTLRELATAVITETKSDSIIIVKPPEDYFPAKFQGCTERGIKLLGFRAVTNLSSGISRLVREYISMIDNNSQVLDSLLKPHFPDWLIDMRNRGVRST